MTMHESGALAKVEVGYYNPRRAMTHDDEITLPGLMEAVKTEEIVEKKIDARRTPNGRTCAMFEYVFGADVLFRFSAFIGV